MVWIYPWGNFVDLGHLFYGTQELIFPLDVHGNFHPILLPVVPRNDHWSPEHYCKRWMNFRPRQGERQDKDFEMEVSFNIIPDSTFHPKQDCVEPVLCCKIALNFSCIFCGICVMVKGLLRDIFISVCIRELCDGVCRCKFLGSTVYSHGLTMHDFRLLPWCKWHQHSFGTLRSVEWYFLSVFLVQPNGPILKGQAVKKSAWPFKMGLIGCPKTTILHGVKSSKSTDRMVWPFQLFMLVWLNFIFGRFQERYNRLCRIIHQGLWTPTWKLIIGNLMILYPHNFIIYKHD